MVYVLQYQQPTLAEALAVFSDLVNGLHPACEAEEPLSPEKFDNLAGITDLFGLQHTIVLDQQQRLVSGRNQLLACCAARFYISDLEILKTTDDPWAVAREQAILNKSGKLRGWQGGDTADSETLASTSQATSSAKTASRTYGKFPEPTDTRQHRLSAAGARTHDIVVFRDTVNTVTDRVDGVRVVCGRDATTYHHADAKADVLVYGDGSVWWYGFANKVSHVFSESRADAESNALRMIQSSLKHAGTPSNGSGLTQPLLFD